MANLLGGAAVIVAGDLRASTPRLVAALVSGLLEGGSDVVDCGEIPTPTFYFARDALGIDAGVMVTASHNPADHNGFKPVLGALPILPEELASLRDLAAAPGPGPAHAARRPGRLRHADVIRAYEAWLDGRVALAVTGDVPSAPVVVDAGHGSLWRLGPAAFERRGFRVARLFCSPDGTFPSRAPIPPRPASSPRWEPRSSRRGRSSASRSTGTAIGSGSSTSGDRPSRWTRSSRSWRVTLSNAKGRARSCSTSSARGRSTRSCGPPAALPNWRNRATRS